MNCSSMELASLRRMWGSRFFQIRVQECRIVDIPQTH
jgi:hypothetical protein